MPRSPGDGRGRLGGRQKGTPNKRTFDARAKAEELGVDPLEVLLRACKRDWEGLGYDGPTTPFITKSGEVIDLPVIGPDLQIKAAKEAVKYLYAALKAIEITGKDGGPLEYYLTMSPEERARLREEIERRLARSKKK